MRQINEMKNKIIPILFYDSLVAKERKIIFKITD